MRLFVQCLLVYLALAGSVQAVEPIYTGYFSNTAIKGYDTVAYFTQKAPVKGDEAYSTEYMGAKWLFANQDNLALFLANPAQYAPQYGGYCAYAVSQNTTASIQPELFTIYNNKLYLNYSEAVNKKWLSNKADFIEQADKHWPKLLKE